MNNGFQHTEEAIKQRGEVFTPPKLVKQMLGKLPQSVFMDPKKTFLDNSCGNGQFLIAVLNKKMEWLKKREGKYFNHFEISKQALSTIYGCELDSNNAENCRLNLLKAANSPLFTPAKRKQLRAIVDHNIITADALDPKSWPKDIGFYWENSPCL